MRKISGRGLGTNLVQISTHHSDVLTGMRCCKSSPLYVNVLHLEESQQRVPHQRNSTSLGGCAEVNDPELPIHDLLDVFLHRSPCRLSDRSSIIIHRGQLDHQTVVRLDLISICDGQSGLFCWSEQSIGIRQTSTLSYQDTLVQRALTLDIFERPNPLSHQLEGWGDVAGCPEEEHWIPPQWE